MLLAEKELTIGWPVRFLLSTTKYHDRSWRKVHHNIFDGHVYRRKCQDCQSVESRPSLSSGKTALFCNAPKRSEVSRDIPRDF